MKNGRAESATADTIGPSATMDRELEWEISLIIGQYVFSSKFDIDKGIGCDLVAQLTIPDKSKNSNHDNEG